MFQYMYYSYQIFVYVYVDRIKYIFIEKKHVIWLNIPQNQGSWVQLVSSLHGRGVLFSSRGTWQGGSRRYRHYGRAGRPLLSSKLAGKRTSSLYFWPENI